MPNIFSDKGCSDGMRTTNGSQWHDSVVDGLKVMDSGRVRNLAAGSI